MINRRIFLKSSGLALVAGGLLPNVFVKMANAATTKGRKVPSLFSSAALSTA